MRCTIRSSPGSTDKRERQKVGVHRTVGPADGSEVIRLISVSDRSPRKLFNSLHNRSRVSKNECFRNSGRYHLMRCSATAHCKTATLSECSDSANLVV